MRLKDIPPRRLAELLASGGVRLCWGPFVAHIVSELPELAGPLRTLYADFETADAGVADFHLRMILRRRFLPARADLIADGRSLFGPFPRAEAVAMLEWGLNSCICGAAHRFLLIHAAIVAQGQSALVLPGHPGSGKSTLATAFVGRGWRLLSDELTVIDPSTASAVPVVRPISLKNESIELVSDLLEGAVMGPAATVGRKGRVQHVRPPEQSVLSGRRPAVPRWIVLPRFEAGGTTALRPLSKAGTFVAVADNALNYQTLGRTAFEALARVVSAAEGYELAYGSIDAALDTLGRLWDRPDVEQRLERAAS